MILLALSDVAREVDHAFKIIGWICLLLLVGIVIFMLKYTIQYRRSRTPRTSQIHGHPFLETMWIVAPTIIVIYMFFVGYKGFKMMREVPDNHMVVEVTGKQWDWSFYYPDFDITTSGRGDALTLPGGKAVKFLLTSPETDVLHSFYLPDFRIKEDCVAGRESYMWLEADMPEPGTKKKYNIFCAEFCGKDHSSMISTMTLVTPEEFSQWVVDKNEEKNTPIVIEEAMDASSDLILAENGPVLYKTYCITCHGPNGRGENETTTELARDFTSLEKWKQGTKNSDIFRTISNGIPGTQMNAFPQLSKIQRFALMHHVADYYKGEHPVDNDDDLASIDEEFHIRNPEPLKDILTVEQAMSILAQQDLQSRAE